MYVFTQIPCWEKKKELAESALPFYEILAMGLLLPSTIPFI